ncbi:uncharacterized protein K444DRAFT_187271 [Hyaloscypha bicolor E]|uniref:Uncharacterized protein n=1 Tax=Hyaloscypha bicolor E TaxID=1095630 RepID=A0A2J6SPG7_9HELO|nr:uncharacterized protein K444DRAFT_187271 [Hyaloscypha bicolor E]PMD52654.1 hypothetical protein K444DRAFT_187271 [Hyaloscypha bicolor E]
MWNCRGKRQRQIRGIPASRPAGTRSRTGHPASSDRSSAAMEYVQRLVSPLATHRPPSRIPRPQPQPLAPSLRTAPVCSNVWTPASRVPPRSLSLWTASRRHLQCDLSEAERSGSSTSSSHEDSTMFLHARLDRGEKIPARRCAGDDPALAMIGRVCRGWPRCQQIHATCAMLHGRQEGETRDESGERRSQVLFVPGVPYILTSKPAAGELSSGLCV